MEAYEYEADQIFAEFLNKIGYDGNAYIEAFDKIPCVKDKLGFIYGKYVSPSETNYLERLMQKNSFNKKTVELARRTGIVVISDELLRKGPENEIILTIMHEKFHARRCVLSYDVDHENDYVMIDGKIAPASDKYMSQYVDPNQDVLKGSIDTSRVSLERINKMNEEERDKIDYDAEDRKRAYALEVDETLVELMTYIAYYVHKHPEKSVMQAVEHFSTIDDPKYSCMCKIILSHGDFDLFYWMLDPITYTAGDIHFDFFDAYTKEDPPELKEPYEDSFTIEDFLGI